VLYLFINKNIKIKISSNGQWIPRTWTTLASQTVCWSSSSLRTSPTATGSSRTHPYQHLSWSPNRDSSCSSRLSQGTNNRWCLMSNSFLSNLNRTNNLTSQIASMLRILFPTPNIRCNNHLSTKTRYLARKSSSIGARTSAPFYSCLPLYSVWHKCCTSTRPSCRIPQKQTE
jgi:hypothetical protein